MTLDYQTGKPSGSMESLVWPVSVWDDGGASVTYEDALSFALANMPTEIFTALRDYDNRHSGEQLNGSSWKFQIVYSDAKPAVNTIRKRMQFVAEPETLWNFREPIAVLNSSTDVTASYPNQKWKIDASGAGLPWGRFQSHGHDFRPLPEVITHDIFLPNASVDDAYLQAIAGLRGTFNDDEFLGIPAKSLQIVRINADQRSATDWELSFGFGYQEQETNIDIGGDIVIPELNACDYYWTRDKTTFNPGSSLVETFPDLCFVGRWGRLGDFSILGYPT